jgi:hypothetical protein
MLYGLRLHVVVVHKDSVTRISPGPIRHPTSEIYLLGTWVNKRQDASLSAVSSLARYSDRRAEDL